jgi:hypothetical protein
VTVPKGGGEVTKELAFTRAYRSITIYLKGLEYLSGGVETSKGGGGEGKRKTFSFAI